MKRKFTKNPVFASTEKKQPLKASYSPELLEELINSYASNDSYTLEDIWNEVYNTYSNESLADDVVDGVENERW